MCWLEDREKAKTDIESTGAINSLAPGKYCSNSNIVCNNSNIVISEHTLRIKFINTVYEIALRWIPKYTFVDKSASVMSSSRQAANGGQYYNN